MELKGFESKAQVARPSSITAPTTSIAAQQSASLASRLESFSNTMFKNQAQVTADQATQDALRDAAQNKPFYKEDVYTAYGKAYNNSLSATYASEADISITKKSFELEQANINNPVGYSKAMDKYISELSSGAPTPELSTVIGLSGNKLKNSTFGRLQIAENQRIRAKQVEVFDQEASINLGQIINLRSLGTPQGDRDAEILEQKNILHLESLVADGSISPAKALEWKDAAQFEVTYGTSIEKFGKMLQMESLEEAQKYLVAQTSENRQDMDIPQNTKHQDDLTRMFNNEVKRRKANETGLKEEANLVLTKVNEILASGKTPPTELMSQAKNMAQYASLSKQDAMKTQLMAYNEVKKFGFMSLPEQETYLSEFKSKPEMTNVDVKVMSAIEQNLSARKTKAKKDPQTLSVEEGINNPLIPIGVSNGVQGLVQGLPQRAKNQTANILEYGKGATQLFTDAEANEWSSVLEDVNTPLSEKIAFMDAIYTTVPTKANAVFNQIRKKGAPLFTYAASMVGEGKPEVAKGILRGQGLLQAAGPQEYIKEFRATLLGKIGNAMTKANPADMEALVDSALAYSMYLAEKRGDITNLKGSNERQAIDDLTNGMHKRNGQDFFLPNTVDDDMFDEWIDETITADKFEGVQGMTKDEALQFVRGNSAKITSVGAGKYAIYDSLGRVLMKSDNTPFILEY